MMGTNRLDNANENDSLELPPNIVRLNAIFIRDFLIFYEFISIN